MTLHVDRAGAGPDLVLLHGWGLHSGVWAEAMPRWAGRFGVHAVDHPGHGHSAAQVAKCFDDAVDQVAAAIPDAAVVCGWSLGGLVAQRLAVRHRAKVRRLVLAGSTPCFVERDDWRCAMAAKTLDEFASGLRADRDATLVDFVQLNALGGAWDREAIRAFSRRIAERGTPSAAGLERGLEWLRETDLRPAASRLDVPTLLIHGGRDRLAPVDAARWLAARMPQARLAQIGDAAHLPFFTHTAVFTSLLESIVD